MSDLLSSSKGRELQWINFDQLEYLLVSFIRTNEHFIKKEEQRISLIVRKIKVDPNAPGEEATMQKYFIILDIPQ